MPTGLSSKAESRRPSPLTHLPGSLDPSTDCHQMAGKIRSGRGKCSGRLGERLLKRALRPKPRSEPLRDPKGILRLQPQPRRVCLNIWKRKGFHGNHSDGSSETGGFRHKYASQADLEYKGTCFLRSFVLVHHTMNGRKQIVGIFIITVSLPSPSPSPSSSPPSSSPT